MNSLSTRHINYSECRTDVQKDRYIQYLTEQNQEHLLTKKAMQLVLEDFLSKQKLMEERMTAYETLQREQMQLQEELKNQVCEERKLRKSAERKVRTLQELLDYAKQECFGDRRQGGKAKG